MLTVERELTMLCSQFLLGALRSDHPSNAVVSANPGPRRIRQTLQSKFLQMVQPYLQDGVTPEDSNRQSLTEIHRGAIADVIASAVPNRVLAQPPSPVSAEEVGFLLGFGGLPPSNR